jgi:hypothetical protein
MSFSSALPGEQRTARVCTAVQHPFLRFPLLVFLFLLNCCLPQRRFASAMPGPAADVRKHSGKPYDLSAPCEHSDYQDSHKLLRVYLLWNMQAHINYD